MNVVARGKPRDVAQKTRVLLSTLLLAGVCISIILPVSAFAKPITLTEKKQVKVGDDVSKWYFTTARDSHVAAQISKGRRKDTAKVVRTLRNDIKGKARGITLDISKEIKLTYEVYTSGPKKGELYRINKPEIKHLKKSARYLGIIKLTSKPRVEVISYDISSDGSALIVLKEQTLFTLPRQFPMKRDTLTELLRKSFKIESKQVERRITIVPKGSYGTVQLDIEN